MNVDKQHWIEFGDIQHQQLGADEKCESCSAWLRRGLYYGDCTIGVAPSATGADYLCTWWRYSCGDDWLCPECLRFNPPDVGHCQHCWCVRGDG